MFGEVTKVIVEDLPFFVPSNLFWGFGLIILSLVLSIFFWHQRSVLGKKGIFLWLINLVIFVFALARISAAFPRLPFWVTFAILFILVFVLAGATVTVSKKEGEKGANKNESSSK